MILRTFTPGPPLSEIVRGFIYFRDTAFPYDLERFLPNGDVEIIINLAPTASGIFHNETHSLLRSCREVWVSGIRTGPITISSGNGSELFVILTRPGRARALLGLPLGELTNTVVERDEGPSQKFRELREILLECENHAAMFQAAAAWLLARADFQMFEPRIARILDEFSAAPGTATVQGLARMAGCSEKHLVNLFRDHLGVPPKLYFRILRFQHCIEKMQAPDSDWSAIAHECGYFDQSHFIAEFREFSGFTPTGYGSLPRSDPNHILLGR